MSAPKAATVVRSSKSGFTCTCGRREDFPMYVAAHWNDALAFTCPKCQKRWTIRSGKVREAKP